MGLTRFAARRPPLNVSILCPGVVNSRSRPVWEAGAAALWKESIRVKERNVLVVGPRACEISRVTSMTCKQNARAIFFWVDGWPIQDLPFNHNGEFRNTA